ncbi:hypothetical protein [Planctomyces sp. SH-PL62]|uniref:hypothetical protein n=1 Tax=Planctomyces sp. SH-PL62 TaxID=1636152 RepID=UPI00078DC2C8|nr:hypothetical protein [Planctomyces sp. SH-PL62]AMV38540.1 hypothetical protein VT85_13975 [Planctomyces sp. SH-PL62]
MDRESCGDDDRGRRGDPNRYKGVGVGLLLADVRDAVDPALRDAGFLLVGRSPRWTRSPQFLDWSRPGELVSISYERSWDWVRLVAVHVSAGGDELRTIASADLHECRSTADVDAVLASFTAAIVNDAHNLRGCGAEA